MKYKVIIQRIRTETCTIEVRAADEGAAEEKAVGQAEANPDKFDWQLEDDELEATEVEEESE